MTHHLSPQEFVESLDGTLATGRLDHLPHCDRCRSEVESLRALAGDVEAAADLRQPSPLFWDHFSARVRHATESSPTPARPSWWAEAWRPVAAFAGGLALVAIAVAFWPRAAAPVAPDATVASVAVTPAESALPDEAPWDLFLTIASTLPWEDVRQVAMPRKGTADALISQLSPAEREALARLIRADIGELE
jgi:hypothetical protein